MAENRTPVVLSGVTKRFGTTTAVDSLSWAPRRGQVTALVGLNGAGKSTTMRVMTGLIKPTEGSVKVAAGDGERALSAMIETPGLFTGMSVRRNLDIHRVLTGAPAAQIDEIAELVQVQDVMGKRVGTLSQGYRQRVAIGVALLGSPAVLLLDEPTNALDPDAILQLRQLIRRVAERDTAVVVSTHQLRELEGTADALTLIHDGQVLYDGPFDDFVGSPSLRIRAMDDAATGGLAAALEAEGIRADRTPDALRVTTDGSADLLATQIFDIAAQSGVKLVELSHVTPTLEEAFHAAISGASS
ncbi:ABC transporter ATP-binding protein [Streptomyces sp. CB01881]|uniref:ABC transporter ATP-binding protein n=1 Tax=Streptomyces sp. CB01881 TaxID=2078691 RepID=UPI0011DF15C3|nr:ABC transporter ATP-binding protein [Streptomyces sp. CB01881]TYC70223.1 ABC transporter ATP-binding protein [Streptomyces sp. CB01881]